MLVNNWCECFNKLYLMKGVKKMENKTIDIVYSYYDTKGTLYFYPNTFVDRVEMVKELNDLKVVKVVKHGFIDSFGNEMIKVNYFMKGNK